MQDQPTQASRRGFFLAASATGVAAAAAVGLAKAPALMPPAPEALPPPPDKGGGYTLSEHVKRYYRTTRV